MRQAFTLVASLLLASCASGVGSVGGADYDPAYDFSEFYRVADGHTFHVIVDGEPFPGVAPDEMRRRLLPVLQASRPRPRLTFTYAEPAEPQHPDYRVALVFNAANDLTAARVCAGQIRHEIRQQPEPAGRVQIFAVYCRNDAALSQAVATTVATSPEDPRLHDILSLLFLVVFSEQPPIRHPPFPFMFGR
jgi:hypothetical protein